MDNYKEYLAANVLNDGKIVTHRSLSRALKVHTSLAKQMLYSFHRSQNAKKPGCCHATYILSGTRKPAPAQANGFHLKDGEDTVMRSSPPVSSLPVVAEPDEPEHIRTTTIMIVKEEHLEKARADFEEVTSIFVYSLEQGSPADLNVLSDCTRDMHVKYASEDPLEVWKQYGTIQNPKVRRRTGKLPTGVGAPAPSTATPTQKPATSASPKPIKPIPSEQAARSIKNGTVARAKAGAHAAPVAELTTAKPAASALKQGKSDLFSSFAKVKAKEKRDSGNARPTLEPKDEPMMDMSDDGDEDLEPMEKIQDSTVHKNTRAERAQKLRDMMEDDEDMEDAPVEEASAPGDEEGKEEELIDKVPSPKADEKAAYVEVIGGRRRGRRRVTRKRTVKDEEGYLVTREEQAWESFSEDEPAPRKAKVLTTTAAPKTKKGQGSIMNFFGKK